jgi:virulence-associated protein VagC
MVRTTVFLSNRSQAVRLPKGVAFPPDVKEVAVLRDGQRRVIVPAGQSRRVDAENRRRQAVLFFAKKNQKTLVYKALALQRRAR